MNTYEVKIDQLYSYHFTVEARSEEEARVSAGWQLSSDNPAPDDFNDDYIVTLIEEDV